MCRSQWGSLDAFCISCLLDQREPFFRAFFCSLGEPLTFILWTREWELIGDVLQWGVLRAYRLLVPVKQGYVYFNTTIPHAIDSMFEHHSYLFWFSNLIWILIGRSSFDLSPSVSSLQHSTTNYFTTEYVASYCGYHLKFESRNSRWLAVRSLVNLLLKIYPSSNPNLIWSQAPDHLHDHSLLSLSNLPQGLVQLMITISILHYHAVTWW